MLFFCGWTGPSPPPPPPAALNHNDCLPFLSLSVLYRPGQERLSVYYIDSVRVVF